MSAASIGVVGTLVGFLVGLLICRNIETIRQFISWLTSTELFSPELYFLSKLPAEIETRMCELFDAELNHDDTPMSAERLIDAVGRAATAADRRRRATAQ